MKNKICIVISLLLILLCGCAAQNIQQGKDLSSSVIAYTEAVDNLLDVTIDQVIDFDSAELRKSRRGSDPRAMIVAKNEIILLNNFRGKLV